MSFAKALKASLVKAFGTLLEDPRAEERGCRDDIFAAVPFVKKGLIEVGMEPALGRATQRGITGEDGKDERVGQQGQDSGLRPQDHDYLHLLRLDIEQ